MPELSDADLAEIRRRWEARIAGLHRQLARDFGVSPDCVDAIVHGRPWRHLAERVEPPLRGLFDAPRR